MHKTIFILPLLFMSQHIYTFNSSSVEDPGYTHFTSANTVRVAFDIGSLTTKMIVAHIRNKRIEKVILKDVRAVGYKHDLERPASDGTFSQEIIEQGIQALRELKAEAEKLSPAPQEYAAVATAALRAGLNNQEVVDRILKELNIPVFIISQEEEARLGFNGAITAVNADAKKAIVWDAGGGSMQMITQEADGSLAKYGNELGFIAFARQVMKDIQQKELNAHTTPNPLSIEDAEKAVQLARQLAQQVPSFIKEKIAAHPTQVIAIGALYYATHGQADAGSTDIYTQTGIRALLMQKLNKRDYELFDITHKAIPTLVSATALALILGFMLELSINSITTVEVNMTDALLVDDHYYKGT